MSAFFDGPLVNCSTAPDTTPSDAGVAGAGILLAFIITAGLSIALSAWIVISELRNVSSRDIARKILNGLSDQMIVEGIAIQVVALVSWHTMVPYHFFIVWMLALLSTATNFASLLALVQDYKRDWVLRWLRQFAMFVNMALTVVLGVFVLKANIDSLPPTLPVYCIWHEHATAKGEHNNTPVSLAGTIAVIVINGVIFVLGTWYLHMRGRQWSGVVRLISLLIVAAVAIATTVRVIEASQAFGKPGVTLADQGERQWSFGQLLTMLLLILPFISALEIIRGQVKVPSTQINPDSEELPLTGGLATGRDRYWKT